MDLVRSLSLFLLAGLCEIGGGYLIWVSLRDGKPAWLGVAGGVALALYGVVAAFQPANFGRVYAAYGGVFIAMALAWGWLVDDVRPDRFDLLGAGLALAGVLVIMYAPRT
ncbi:MAG: YnfA family protein [Truepera sp.]|jgi:small multidrug resistance family-3 protein|nr:YnfA family protein [Truepera sp.]